MHLKATMSGPAQPRNGDRRFAEIRLEFERSGDLDPLGVSVTDAFISLRGSPLDLTRLNDRVLASGFSYIPWRTLGHAGPDQVRLGFRPGWDAADLNSAELLIIHGSAYEHGGHTGTLRSDDHRIFIDDKEALHYENYIGISGIYASAVTATTPSRKRLESIGCEYLQFFDTMLVSHKDGEPVHEGGGYGAT